MLRTKVVIASVILSGCSIKAELTLERTALENQIMGSYDQIEDEFVMAAPIAAVTSRQADQPVSDLKKKAIRARQNRVFNADDIDELKDNQVLGEGDDGKLYLLSGEVGLAAEATKQQLKLARLLVAEENSDREVLWQREVQGRTDLTEENLPLVRAQFASSQRKVAKTGHWLRDKNGVWKQKAD